LCGAKLNDDSGNDELLGKMQKIDEKGMNGGLFGVGVLSLLIGTIFLYLGFNQKVSADTDFGKFSGGIGAVAVIMGIVMMGISTLA
jgi:hypothetical protein